jgi:hypothetical protein
MTRTIPTTVSWCLLLVRIADRYFLQRSRRFGSVEGNIGKGQYCCLIQIEDSSAQRKLSMT